MSEKKIGHPHYNTGKTWFKKDSIPWNKNKTAKEDSRILNGERSLSFGKSPTQNTREKMAKAKLGKRQTEEWLDMRKKLVLPVKDTKPEIKLQNLLKALNIEFFTHQYMHIEHGYQCDVFIPSTNTIIECFGDYWHKYPIGREIDTLRCQELRAKGYKVLVFWEREIKVMELNDLKQTLK